MITGATGFVGSAIILELLHADPHAQILALVRAEHDEAARVRLHDVLERAARLLGLAPFDDGHRERCHAVSGDVEQPLCGVQPSSPLASRWAGAELWHCAASIEFKPRYAAEVTRTNVEGTRHALALAHALGVHTFDMVSTAYVAGTRTGTILEAPVDAATFEGNNHYERSKVAAEGLVLAAGLRARILRPSIVIGSSRTLAALNYSGLYGFTRALYKFRQLMERTQAQLMDTLEMRLLTDVDGTLDLVPVDFVARDAVGLSQAHAAPGVYHLAGVARLPTVRVIEEAFGAAGLRAPVFVRDRAELTWLDRKLDEGVSIYSAYLFGDKRFDRTAVDRWLPHPAGAGYSLPIHELRRFCDHYVTTELATRAPLPETT